MKLKNERPLVDYIYLDQRILYKRFQQHQARVKMSLIDMKINEYFSQKGHGPQNLQELNLPAEVLIDNFSGKEFLFDKSDGSIKVKNTYMNEEKKK